MAKRVLSSTESKKKLCRNDSISIPISNETRIFDRKYFHTSIEWNISCARIRVREPSQVIISPAFQCSNNSWQLNFYPRGIKSAILGPVFYLNMADCLNPCDYTAYFDFQVSDQDGKLLCTFVSQKCKFVSSTSKERALVFDDIFPATAKEDPNMLSIFFNLYVEENAYPVAHSNTPSNDIIKDARKNRPMLGRSLKSLSSDFKSLYDNGQFSDVTLKLGEEELKAHKLVLCARSKVFAAMFDHDMEENQHNTVDVVGMEYDTLKEMVRYIYSGQIRALSDEEALKMYVAADRYDVAELKISCREMILTAVTLSNVCDIAEVADLHNDELLISSVKAFVSENGKEIVKTEKWRALSACKPTLCVKMYEWTLSE